MQHESTYARDFPSKLREKYPTTCSQALLQMYALSFILTTPVLNKEMRICRHCRQTGGREISLVTIFWHRFFYKTRIQH